MVVVVVVVVVVEFIDCLPKALGVIGG